MHCCLPGGHFTVTVSPMLDLSLEGGLQSITKLR